VVLDVPVGSIARPIITIDEEASVTDASKMMVSNSRGSVVVTRKGSPVGILTERDVMTKVVAKSIDPTSIKAKQVMTSSPIAVEKDRSLREAIDLMNRKGLRRMLVSENGKIVGIFTLRDVVKHTRICAYCGKEIKSILDTAEPDAFTECECGSRYHRKCAETVVNCVTCSRTLVASVINPEPSDTSGG